jgi:hypothetical protein
LHTLNGISSLFMLKIWILLVGVCYSNQKFEFYWLKFVVYVQNYANFDFAVNKLIFIDLNFFSYREIAFIVTSLLFYKQINFCWFIYKLFYNQKATSAIPIFISKNFFSKNAISYCPISYTKNPPNQHMQTLNKIKR